MGAWGFRYYRGSRSGEFAGAVHHFSLRLQGCAEPGDGFGALEGFGFNHQEEHCYAALNEYLYFYLHINICI